MSPKVSAPPAPGLAGAAGLAGPGWPAGLRRRCPATGGGLAWLSLIARLGRRAEGTVRRCLLPVISAGIRWAGAYDKV